MSKLVPKEKDCIAFESDMFTKVFPHKIHLDTVMCHDQQDLINAINELCLGQPTDYTIAMLHSLSRPIKHTDDTVYIFGMNFDVNYFNHIKLQEVNAPLSKFTSKDKGPRKYMKLTNAPRLLGLKVGYRVIITCNLDNGLVNGLTAKVLSIKLSEIEIQVKNNPYLQHGMGGQVFKIHRYTFTVCEADGTIPASRYEFPVRLGYATTVDKAQGRTIASLVVDCYSLWKAAHIGVAIGRAISTDGLGSAKFKFNCSIPKTSC